MSACLPLSSSLALKKKKLTMPANPTTPSRSPSPERSMNKNVKVRRGETGGGNGSSSFFFLSLFVFFPSRANFGRNREKKTTENAMAPSTRQRGFFVRIALARARLVVCFLQQQTEMGEQGPASEH